MSKEKVFIVMTHKHSLKRGTKNDWEVTEVVEFVNQLRNKHTTMSSAIGDYLNKKMVTGARMGMNDYDKFETYVRTKYEKQMSELDAAYGNLREPEAVEPAPEEKEVYVDAFGNVRAKTVFDAA